MIVALAKRPASALRQFIANEAAGGFLLIGAAVVAMLLANSPAASTYFDVLHAQTGQTLTPKLGPMTVHLWINDGLMAIFFFVVGLEIKREFIDGRLANWDDRRLPVVAAFGGMAAPALVYLAVVSGNPELTRGWAIPAATDIAFALGLLALLGKRAPTSLKLFLTTVAIIDDVGAVIVIALFYTASLNLAALAASAGVVAVMFAMNRMKIMRQLPYVFAFAVLWYFVLLSGVHATVAGVVAALAVPIIKTPGAPDSTASTLHRMENRLHPWVAYAIVPIFGLANAGVTLGGGASAVGTLPLAIALGLFVGKQLGVFGGVWIAVKLKFAMKPAGTNWMQVYGVSLLCGIGFTMSLFIGGLAFPLQPEADAVKIGVLSGSVVSAILGFLMLRFSGRRVARPQLAPKF